MNEIEFRTTCLSKKKVAKYSGLKLCMMLCIGFRLGVASALWNVSTFEKKLDRIITDRVAASDAIPDIEQSPPSRCSVMKATVRRYAVLDTE